MRQLTQAITIAVIVAAFSMAAFAQLTEDDIALLRQQAQAQGWTFDLGLNDATSYSLGQLAGSDEMLAPDYDPDYWLGHFCLALFLGCSVEVDPSGNTFEAYDVEGILINADKYTPGQQVTLRAKPGLGWVFDSWVVVDVSGADDLTITNPTENPLMVTMDGDKLISPLFKVPGEGKAHPDLYSRLLSHMDPTGSYGEQNKALPAALDWRASGGVTPVKHQMSCGSCWSFATVAVVESLIKIKDGVTTDLSEQWLVSNNTNGWGCSGGFYAFDFFLSRQDSCGTVGAVLESDFPYTATDAAPVCPANRPYKIASWTRVDRTRDVPTTTQIKQAIMDHGPVWAAVNVTNAFQAYTSGVFNASVTNEGVNHAIVLVGWDDSMGKSGAWILRNSWGPGWGIDGGYMYIEYGCSLVGYAASYAVYNTGSAPPTEVPQLSVNPNNVNVGAAAGTRDTTIANVGSGNMRWNAKVTKGTDWLGLSAPSGGALRLHHKENTSASSRTGTVVVGGVSRDGVTANSSPITITITQAGASTGPGFTCLGTEGLAAPPSKPGDIGLIALVVITMLLLGVVLGARKRRFGETTSI